MCDEKTDNENKNTTPNCDIAQNSEVNVDISSKLLNEHQSMKKLKRNFSPTSKQIIKTVSEKIDVQTSIKKFLDNESSESLSEFETPRKVARKIVSTSKVSGKRRTMKKEKPSTDIRTVWNKQNSQQDQIYEKLITEHSRIEQVDIDQLQIALALSKSIADVNVDEPSDDKFSVSDAMKKTIQKFGFKTNCKGKSHTCFTYYYYIHILKVVGIYIINGSL